jgi:Caspase domain
MATNPHLAEVDDAKKAVKRALIIGVSEYEDQSLESLPFCKNDAEEMYRLLASPEIGFEIPDSNKIIGKVKDKEMRKAIARFSCIIENHSLVEMQ